MKEAKKPVNKGIISTSAKGTGFVAVEGFEEDVIIESQSLNTAMNGDEIEISLLPQVKSERTQGEVVKVLKRAKMEFVGTIDKKKGDTISFVIPDDTKMYMDIFLPAGETKTVQHNQKVLVRLKDWTDPKKNPEGKVLKVLGMRGDNEVEMESIVIEKGFEMGYPPKVEAEAKELEKKSKPISQKDIAERRDFRDVTTFTIDPADAKDFDDAISFKEISAGLYEIGVHIADVSHYVRPDTQLDKEARRRGVSIYLVDRTIPMLPEILSNDICSLNAHEDKLTYAAVMTITSDGRIKEVWFGKTIINSNRRFVYEEAQKVLDDKKGEYYEELNILNKIAKIFKTQRMKAGALDFEKDEVKFKLDSKGKPIGVVKKIRTDIHKLVEEFMVLANKEVATYLSKDIKKINKGASVYRIHDVPKKKNIEELLFLLKALGHDIEIKRGDISSKELNALLEKIKGRPEESLVKTVAMRSMAKAIYSIKNIGHYGLALEHYTHFTSPIRRYADLMVHRVLEKHLKGQSLNADEAAWYHDTTIGLTDREIDDSEAERASIAYKQVEYMMERVGQIYDGVISGITNWGVYVEELETGSSGMIKFKDMKDDFYEFKRESFSLVGTKHKNKYSIGDKVKVKVLGGDLGRRTLDYMFVS